MGRFQLEAPIQSVHARRAVSGTVDWPTIRRVRAFLRERSRAEAGA